jgi:predicted PurR-regulated permease PerM
MQLTKLNNMQKHTINISTEIIIKVVAVVLGLGFLYVIRDVLALFFVAMILMASIDPLVTWFHGKVRIPRGVGVMIIYLFLVSFFVTTLAILIPALSEDFKNFTRDLPENSKKVNQFFEGVSIYGQSFGFTFEQKDIVDSLRNELGKLSSNIFSTTLGFLTGIISLVVVLAMAFYMSIKEDGMEKFLSSVSPDKYRSKVINIGQKIKTRIGKWMGGQLILMGIIFLLDFLVLYMLGVPYAIIIALLGGFLEIIPYIGPMLSTFIATLVALLVSPVKAIVVLISYILIQQAENHIILPQIMKKAVGLNPLSVILAILIGAKIAGVLGVILAVPVATAIGIMVKEAMKEDFKAEEREAPVLK